MVIDKNGKTEKKIHAPVAEKSCKTPRIECNNLATYGGRDRPPAQDSPDATTLHLGQTEKSRRPPPTSGARSPPSTVARSPPATGARSPPATGARSPPTTGAQSPPATGARSPLNLDTVDLTLGASPPSARDKPPAPGALLPRKKRSKDRLQALFCASPPKPINGHSDSQEGPTNHAGHQTTAEYHASDSVVSSTAFKTLDHDTAPVAEKPCKTPRIESIISLPTVAEIALRPTGARSPPATGARSPPTTGAQSPPATGARSPLNLDTVDLTLGASPPSARDKPPAPGALLPRKKRSKDRLQALFCASPPKPINGHSDSQEGPTNHAGHQTTAEYHASNSVVSSTACLASTTNAH
ncbi:proline-rich receptor-like protein kinase PERK12 [Formica exsecta]|uniref:proline-rich receptor-like protein kinase PERK12 n=1 Tax=Formica exsecta TaxID=72781 RepID=UPI0011416726|nr:proline-rich receptor-like protein kinase PERK12 [Formica exsecta]